MANTTLTNPAAALGEAARYGEIRGRLFFLIGVMVVYRIGTFIPVPGIDPQAFARFFNDQGNTILGIANMFSGGALQRMSIFAMGVMPYISASIIIQMMSMIVPMRPAFSRPCSEPSASRNAASTSVLAIGCSA